MHFEGMYFRESDNQARRLDRPAGRGLRALTAALCVSGFIISNAAQAAAIYKTVDANGNIIFTDQPLEDAQALNREAVEIARQKNPDEPGEPAAATPQFDSTGEPIDVVPRRNAGVLVAPAPKNPPKSEYKAPEEPRIFLPVTVVEILTPIHNTTLNDPIGKIWVELQSYPTPLKKTGLTAQLWMNDRLITSGQRPMLSIDPPERGTHVLQVKLVDENGRLYLESDATHLHVKYKVAQ